MTRCLVWLCFFAMFQILTPWAAVRASPPAQAGKCTESVVEDLLFDEPSAVRSAALLAALECDQGIGHVILGQIANELAIEAYAASGDPLTKVRDALRYLARADDELRLAEPDMWRQVRLVRLQVLENESDLLGSRDPLDEARALLQELRGAELSGPDDDIDVLERTVWLESALRFFRDPDAWQRAMVAADFALRSPLLAEELLYADLLAQKAVLLDLGPIDRQPSDAELAAGVAAHEEAISRYERLGSEKAVNERINLATLLIRIGDLSSLKRARTLATQAAGEANDPVVRGTALLTLGNAYFQEASGDAVTSNEEAIRTYREALSVLPDGQHTRVTAQFNLVLALQSSTINVDDYLLEAEGLARALASQLPNRYRARAKQVLGSVLLSQAKNDPDRLPAAATALADAAALQDDLEVEQRAGLFGDTAELVRLKLALGRATLAEAEAAYQQAIEFAAANYEWRIWASYQNNLGNLYADRKQPNLIPLARKAYEAALTVRTPDALPTEYVDTITNLASLDFFAGRWREAADRYTTVLSTHLELFQATDGGIRQAALESSKRRFERAAYALARDSKLWEALAVVELGRARTIKKRLGESLEGASYASALQWRPAPPPAGVLVLVPVITTKGTMVLGMMDTPVGMQIDALFLDRFSADSVVAHVAGEGGWLESYERATNFATASGDIGLQVSTQLPQGIDAVDAWLGSAFVEPVIDWAKQTFQRPFGRIAFSVQGELAILPLQSALLPDGKRLVADYEVSYLPSLALLVGRAQPAQSNLFAAVSNPSSDSRLPVSNLEAGIAARSWAGTREEIPPAEVTPDRFLAAFRKAGTLLFVGHGKYDPADPLASYLVLAGGEHLSVAQIQESAGSGAPHLVILSACETGIVGVRTASNEFEGLSGAFLALGADGVIASLWPVNEFSTMLLMGHFYDELGRGTRPSKALADAQNWLANAPASELATIVERQYLPAAIHDSVARPALGKFRAFLKSSRTDKVFSSAYYWAGLIYTGALGA